MKVSVIVLNWNGRPHLADCLSSLAAQVQPGDEVIVVDNGTTRDDSVEFVSANFPSVRLVVLNENRGFSGGNNAGLRHATGDGIFLLNNDTRLEPGCLERLRTCALRNSALGVVAAHLVDWEGQSTDSAGDGCRVTGRGYGRNRRQPAETAPASGPVFGACAGAALYRRALIDEVGFLDDDFFLNFEDTDLSFRARLRGWEVWFCREAVVRHRVSASQGAWSPTNTFYGARNHLWVCWKNLPLSLLLKYAPLTFFEITAMGLAAARRGQFLPYLRGLAAGVGGFFRMRAKRKVIQHGRKITPRELERWLTAPHFSWAAFRRMLRI